MENQEKEIKTNSNLISQNVNINQESEEKDSENNMKQEIYPWMHVSRLNETSNSNSSSK